MALAARDSIALPSLSSAGWFFPLPELPYAAGNVAPPACPLALAAARALSVVMREGAQNDSRLATIAGEQVDVEPVGPWPRYGAPKLPPHDGPSDSNAR